MRKKFIEVQAWRVGDTVISNLTDFGITKGNQYVILKQGNFGDCFFIKDDTGEIVEYTEEYFDYID